MTVALEDLDTGTGGWFGARPWDHEFCRRENHIDVPEGELCQGCFHPIADDASGYALDANGLWVYWHFDCYWEHVAEKDDTGLVLERLDDDYDPW